MIIINRIGLIVTLPLDNSMYPVYTSFGPLATIRTIYCANVEIDLLPQVLS